jgi:hypothetical protein
MQNKMNIIQVIKSASKDHWRDAVWWFIFTLIGSLWTVYGSFFLLKLFSQKITIADFCSKGEFALYSAAILVTIFHLLWKDSSRGPYINLRIFSALSLVLFFFASLIFAGVTTADVLSSSKPSILNQKLLIPASIGIFIVTLIIGFIVTLIDAVRLVPDLGRNEKNEIEDLQRAFKKTGD